jgi:hypothetical protein
LSSTGSVFSSLSFKLKEREFGGGIWLVKRSHTLHTKRREWNNIAVDQSISHNSCNIIGTDYLRKFRTGGGGLKCGVKAELQLDARLEFDYS